MYQRRIGQMSYSDDAEMFGTIPLDSKNEWVKMSRIVPFDEFDLEYAKLFKSKKGQPAIDSRIALGALLIQTHYKFSDENVTAEIAMNPYLQFFIGLHSFTHKCPFDASMMTRFRQRITPEMLAWVNDKISGRPDSNDNDNDTPQDDGKNGGENSTDSSTNEGTLTLDATCVPQNIRFPTDVSLLNEAREKSDAVIDILRDKGLTGNKRPRTYRRLAKNRYNHFSKKRKKSKHDIKKAKSEQLRYLKRNLSYIDKLEESGKFSAKDVLSEKEYNMLEVIRLLYSQQSTMYQTGINRIDNRIVSITEPWIRPIVRGKQNADVEFGAKVEMSVVDGFLRIEDLRWDAFNESTTFIASVESYRKAYGHYPKRVLADTIFRTRANLNYCTEHGIHLNGPKLGKPSSDPNERKLQKRLEWLESGERGEIERLFGVAKTRYSLDCIVTKLKNTSEVSIYTAVLYINLRKRLRLLLRFFVEKLNFVWSLCSYMDNYGTPQLAHLCS